MAVLQFSTAVRNARLDAVEAAIGTAPKLRLLTGTMPADCAAADTGTLIHTMTLPSDWMAAASGGQKTMAGTWSATSSGAGTVGYYRIYNSANTVCHEQGNITVTGGGGSMTIDNLAITAGQTITVTLKTLIDGNA